MVDGINKTITIVIVVIIYRENDIDALTVLMKNNFQFRRFLIPYGTSNWGLPTNLMTAMLLAIWQYNHDEQFVSER